MTRHHAPALALKAAIDAHTTVPPSFNGDMTLYAISLFVMTAMTFVATMLFGRQVLRLWHHRRDDHPLHPVSLLRIIILLASGAAMLRCGGEAALLWGWDAADPVMTARVLTAKRYIDPIAVGLGFAWMIVHMLAEPGLEFQLRRSPLPVDMWSRWPVLARAAGVCALALIAALAAVILR